MIKAKLSNGSIVTSRPQTDEEYEKEIQTLLANGAKLIVTALPSSMNK